MVWLGYSLEIENNYFNFTPTRMRDRFHNVYEKFSGMTQYIRSINVRRKIFEVYVRPVIDWFVPTILTGKWHANTRSNEIEIFQQKCLSVVAGMAGKVSRTELNRNLGFHSVYDNCTIVASRIRKFFPRDVEHLKSSQDTINMTLRSGFMTFGETWRNCNHLDLGDRCHYLNANRTTTTPPRFDAIAAKAWKIRKNKIIRRKMLERATQ